MVGPGAGAAGWSLLNSLQPATVSAAPNQMGAAQRRRVMPISRRRIRPDTVVTRFCGKLILAQQLDLPHPERFQPRAPTGFDPAADSNPSIFKGFKHNPGGFERRYCALWDSHSKVSCPVPSKIKVGRCPGLPN